MEYNKILCIQHRQMGDVLMCTPALRLLRENVSDAEIHFLTEYAGSQVLKNNPVLDKVIKVERKMSLLSKIKLIKSLRKEKYDLVIDFFNNPTSALITFFTGAKNRCSFSSGTRQWAFNHILKNSENFSLEYSARTKARLLTLLDIKVDAIPDIEMIVSEGERRKAANFWKSLAMENEEVIVALCTASRRNYKLWPYENFAYIADKLCEETGVKIWLVYGPGEYEMAKKVADQMKHAPIIDYEVPDLLTLRAILEKPLIYIGVDGGNKHLAITAGTPTLTIFRQLNPENWTPENSNIDFAFAEGNPGQPPLGSIKKEDVLNKALEMINHIKKGGRNG